MSAACPSRDATQSGSTGYVHMTGACKLWPGRWVTIGSTMLVEKRLCHGTFIGPMERVVRGDISAQEQNRDELVASGTHFTGKHLLTCNLRGALRLCVSRRLKRQRWLVVNLHILSWIVPSLRPGPGLRLGYLVLGFLKRPRVVPFKQATKD